MTIYHARGSYEIGVEFERVGTPQERFNLYETLKWAKESGKIGEILFAGYQASSRDAVQKIIPQMAQLVKDYGELLLQEDVETYRALREQQALDAAEYTKEVRLRATRKQVEIAWHNKDYEAVVRLYQEMQDSLTSSEFMRLQYAEKQVLSVQSSRTKNN